ncbi:hypothetical protein ACIOKD_01510 [Streptomyces sp. NPDC087844]|uniref:hypothetical protein n=1 Tax=Streptomyces sp. NPDC087844 TaxID=3365805 RepID=UPI0038007121
MSEHILESQEKQPMKNVRASLITTLVSALALTAFALVPTAHADSHDVPAAPHVAMDIDGKYQVWGDTNYTGMSCAWINDDMDWRTCPNGTNFNDLASAWQNRGFAGSYGSVRVFENIGYGGASTCAPNASQGNIPWEWNDRISSHYWTNC